jgi:formylglycine-generating enzyme required for sulfatase activity
MKRLIQYPAVGCLLAAWLAAVAATDFAGPASGQATDGLPRVEKAGHKAYTETIPDSKGVKFDMVAVPGGTFLMGSPPGEKGRTEDEGPQHPVQIRPFWMGKTEVVWEEYDLWWKDAPGNKEAQMDAEKKGLTGKDFDALTRPTPPYADETFGHGRDGRPVLAVTHHAAMEYCYWLSQKTGKTYRLPTEAEWEWACRAGTATAYSFGDDPAHLGDYAWYKKNSEDLTQPVGKKKPNPWGLHDLHGNVGEWCLDQFDKDAYGKFPAGKVTLSPVLLPTDRRFGTVVRGGAWADEPARLRSAARSASDKRWIRQDPQQPRSIWWLTDADFVGFRVVRAVEEQEELKNLRSKVRWESN